MLQIGVLKFNKFLGKVGRGDGQKGGSSRGGEVTAREGLGVCSGNGRAEIRRVIGVEIRPFYLLFR